jgi:hypothetical protein
MAGGSYSSNYIGNSTFITRKDTIYKGVELKKGSQLKTPVNVKGYYNLRSLITYGLPVSKLKSNLNLSLSGTYTKTPGYVNEILNYSQNPTISLGIALTSNISKEFDFTISSTSTNNYTINSLNSNLNNTFFFQSSRVKVNWILKESFVFNTELNHQYYSGLSNLNDPNRYIWSAGVGYKFLKDKKGEFRLSVFDILKQNVSVSRNVTETFTEDIESNILQRYFLLSFNYTIKSFGEKSKTKKGAVSE